MKNKLILFQGDSLTDAGRDKNLQSPNIRLGEGYVNMIAGMLGVKRPDIDVLNRGVYGNRIADLYGRWQEDTLNIKFDLLSILCGVNDVGFSIRRGKGSDAERFEFIYDRMIYEVKQVNPDAKIILCQPFLFRMDLEGTDYLGNNKNDIYIDWKNWEYQLRQRQEVVLKLSQKYGTMYAPFADRLKEAEDKVGAERLSIDCIHLRPAGHYILAQCWIESAKEFLEE